MGDLEDMRDKLNVVTSMVVVGGGDDQLRLTKTRKKLDKVTQSMVDKCIMVSTTNYFYTFVIWFAFILYVTHLHKHVHFTVGNKHWIYSSKYKSILSCLHLSKMRPW